MSERERERESSKKQVLFKQPQAAHRSSCVCPRARTGTRTCRTLRVVLQPPPTPAREVIPTAKHSQHPGNCCCRPYLGSRFGPGIQGRTEAARCAVLPNPARCPIQNTKRVTHECPPRLGSCSSKQVDDNLPPQALHALHKLVALQLTRLRLRSELPHHRQHSNLPAQPKAIQGASILQQL